MDHKTKKLPLGVKYTWSPHNCVGGAKTLKLICVWLFLCTGGIDSEEINKCPAQLFGTIEPYFSSQLNLCTRIHLRYLKISCQQLVLLMGQFLRDAR